MGACIVNINIICVGNIKEDYLVSAINEYKTRISKWANVKIVELKEEKLPKNYSAKDIEILIEKESSKIMENIKGYNILMDIQGKQLDSVELSQKIADIQNVSSTINFIIGGSHGVSDKLKQQVDYKLSFSKMTFPHQLFRVMLLEQVYRAFTILNNITYHK